VIGLGGNESLDGAMKFVSRNKLKFQNFWDEDGSSWSAFKVPGNPAAAFVSADGKLLKSWVGGVPEEKEILALVA
jgi:hypothetical protein